MSSENTQNTFSIRSVLKEDKLNGSNFLTWYRNLRIVLRQEKKDYVLENVLPEKPANNASTAVKNAWEKHSADVVDATCLMLATMQPDLQMQFELVRCPIEMIASLKTLFQEQARTERYDTVKSLLECKLAKDAPVSPHVLKMMGYLDNLGKLDCPISQELACDIILQSLPSSYDQFILNFNMNNLTASTIELHGMLKTAEPNVKKANPNVLMVQKGKGFKKPAKGKGKGKVVQDKPKPNPKSKAKPTDVCRFCKKAGHWRKDCKEYQEGLEKLKKTYEVSSSGIYVIEVNVTTSSNTNWVLDTGCGAHICTNVQALKNSRRLRK